MNARQVQWAGALLVVVVGVWAGMEMYTHWAAHWAPHVRVPAGEASPSTRADLGDPAGGDFSEPFSGPLDAALPPPKVPERLPAFSLTDLAGKPTPIATWGDKSLIINFWATWCAPCRHEIPLLESLSKDWDNRGVEVVGIAVDHRDAVLAFAHELKIGYPLLIGEQDALDVASTLGFESPVFPFSVFTDRRGEVVTIFVGELHRPQAELILSVVQNLNENRLQLRQARASISERLRALAPAPAG